MKPEASLQGSSLLGFLLLVVVVYAEFLVILEDGCALFVQLLPGAKSSKGALAMGVDMLESVNVASVHPSESVVISDTAHEEERSTYPSVATPLKSRPWFPYSASTRWGSTVLVTSYFSTTTPL
jgi:hypothetical protein